MKPTIASLVIFISMCYHSFSQVTYTESFDGSTFVPSGWTNLLVSGTNTWTRVTAGTSPTQSTHSGAGEAKFNSFTTSGGVRALVSPVIDMSIRGASAATVSFWMYRDNGYNTTADKIDVYMNTAANLTGANLLGTINRAIGLTPTVAANGWYQYTFSVPASYTTSINYFILKGTSAWGNNIFIDDVSWTAFPAPTIDMMATALISPNSNFSCFSGNQSVSIQIKNNGTTNVNFSTNPVTITSTVGITTAGTVAVTSSIVITPYVLNTGTLAAGASLNVVITNSLNMLISGTYVFNVKTNITGDALTSNDAMPSTSLIVSKVGNYPFEADFGNIPIPDFLVQQINGTGLWTNATTGNLSNPTLTPVLNSGNGYAYFNSYSYSSGTVSNLITPSFDMSNIGNPKFDLWVSQDAGWTGYNDKLDILISTDGGVTWSSSMLTILRYNAAYATPGWKLFTVPLAAYAGNPCVRIAIQATSAFGNNIAIDYLKVYDAGGILPIKLIDFVGEKISDTENLLTWETAEEVNTKFFKIEISSDGVNFSTVNVQNASGDNIGKTYHFIDTLEQQMPISYYRLVSIDEDNSNEVFKIISIERNYPKKFQALLYPNPSYGNSTLDIDMENEGDVQIEIHDIQGNLITEEIVNLNEGGNKIKLDLESSNTGIYFVNVINLNNKNCATMKLVVM